ncbi:hypothetical protein [Actinacidiphila soli]|uniref:hypothetical protein n=1 Tax=Actinacidiphila soli TaxID=2487275 RepID=UPI000FC9B4EB|nr:hypothetical protein [Actinacidiphila soli]
MNPPRSTDDLADYAAKLGAKERDLSQLVGSGVVGADGGRGLPGGAGEPRADVPGGAPTPRHGHRPRP